MLGRGNSLSTMQRRMQLVPDEAWQRYVTNRRERADDGCFTLEYAVYLTRDGSATRSRPSRTQSDGETGSPDPDHEIIHGRAEDEMPQRASKSVNVVITSPPYWPVRRLYIPDDPEQIGLEPTWEAYLDQLGKIFSEVYRVLRDDGTCWVVLDDAISAKPYSYAAQSYNFARSPMKAKQIQLRTHDTTYLAPVGDWLGIPTRFAFWMQANGWHWRDQIIWDKGATGRKESTSTRCRHNYEVLLMFTKSASGYWYDQDALRIPLAGGQPHSVKRGSLRTRGWDHAGPRKDGLVKGYTGVCRSEDGTLRNSGERDFRVFSNPLGRISDAIWTIPSIGWKGVHSSAMSERLVKNCLLLSCPPGGVVLDPFGGSGTVSKVAKELGLRSIYIDRHLPFVMEARQRLARTGNGGNEDTADDNQPPLTTAAD
jgi:DNA modification methylase